MKREARPGYPASRRLWIEDLGLIPKFGRYRLHCKICKADFDSKLHAITSHEDTAKHEAAEAQAAEAQAISKELHKALGYKLKSTVAGMHGSAG